MLITLSDLKINIGNKYTFYTISSSNAEVFVYNTNNAGNTIAEPERATKQVINIL